MNVLSTDNMSTLALKYFGSCYLLVYFKISAFRQSILFKYLTGTKTCQSSTPDGDELAITSHCF